MPRVTIKTGFPAPDGEEEVLTEYLCDWPGCSNVGVHVLGCIPELRAMAVVCEEHSPPASGKPSGSGEPTHPA
jgi:hypothetical protein